MNEVKIDEVNNDKAKILYLDLPIFPTNGNLTESKTGADSVSEEEILDSRKSVNLPLKSPVKMTWYMRHELPIDTNSELRMGNHNLELIQLKRRRSRQLWSAIFLLIATSITAIYISTTPVRKNYLPRQVAYFAVGLLGFAGIDSLRRSMR